MQDLPGHLRQHRQRYLPSHLVLHQVSSLQRLSDPTGHAVAVLHHPVNQVVNADNVLLIPLRVMKERRRDWSCKVCHKETLSCVRIHEFTAIEEEKSYDLTIGVHYMMKGQMQVGNECVATN